MRQQESIGRIPYARVLFFVARLRSLKKVRIAIFLKNDVDYSDHLCINIARIEMNAREISE